MDNVDLLNTGGEVITHNGRKHANVIIQDGKIAGVLPSFGILHEFLRHYINSCTVS